MVLIRLRRWVGGSALLFPSKNRFSKTFLYFVSASTPGAIEDLNLFGRKSKFRRSARATIGYPDTTKGIQCMYHCIQLNLFLATIHLGYMEIALDRWLLIAE